MKDQRNILFEALAQEDLDTISKLEDYIGEHPEGTPQLELFKKWAEIRGIDPDLKGGGFYVRYKFYPIIKHLLSTGKIHSVKEKNRTKFFPGEGKEQPTINNPTSNPIKKSPTNATPKRIEKAWKIISDLKDFIISKIKENPYYIKPSDGDDGRIIIRPSLEYALKNIKSNTDSFWFDVGFYKDERWSGLSIVVYFAGARSGTILASGKQIKSNRDLNALLPGKPKGSELKKNELLKTIAEDLKYFNPGARRDDGPNVDGNVVAVEFRHLGRWIDDEEDGQDEYEDNDQRVWAPGEYKKYATKFKEWAQQRSWYKKTTLSVDTSEKDWVSFSVTLK